MDGVGKGMWFVFTFYMDLTNRKEVTHDRT